MRDRLFEYFLPVVVWLVVIYTFSTDAFSSSRTFTMISTIVEYFFPWATLQQIAALHGIVRKAGHVIEYFILALFTYRCLRFERQGMETAAISTGIFVLVAALTDEFHQSLTISRGASLIDVGYDCLGAAWAIGLITGYDSRRLRSHTIL